MVEPHNPLVLENAAAALPSVEANSLAEIGLPIMEQWGLRERRPARTLFPPVSNDFGGMYFEAYQVPEVRFTAILRGGGDWRWRFCASDGRVEVTSGSYPSEAACIAAIDILRGGAGTADLRQHEDE